MWWKLEYHLSKNHYWNISRSGKWNGPLIILMVTKTSSGAVSYLRSIYLLCKAQNHYPVLFKQTTSYQFSVFFRFSSRVIHFLYCSTSLHCSLCCSISGDGRVTNWIIVRTTLRWFFGTFCESFSPVRLTLLQWYFWKCNSALVRFPLLQTGGRRRCMLPFPGSCPTRSSCLDQRVENCKKSWREIHKIIFC